MISGDTLRRIIGTVNRKKEKGARQRERTDVDRRPSFPRAGIPSRDSRDQGLSRKTNGTRRYMANSIVHGNSAHTYSRRNVFPLPTKVVERDAPILGFRPMTLIVAQLRKRGPSFPARRSFMTGAEQPATFQGFSIGPQISAPILLDSVRR